MTDYNDGKWHGWNGGECPVHHKTTVEVATAPPIGGVNEGMANRFVWDHADYLGNPIIAFRVIKEHREPSDFWIGYNWVAYASLEAAHGSFGTASGKPIHVREVLE